MNYQIIQADQTIGQIQVAYKKDDGTIAAVYAIDVPIIEGRFITGDALHQEIIHRAPTWAITREQEVQSATGFDQILLLVEQLNTQQVQEMDSQTAENAKMWEQHIYEKRLAEVLIKFGLLNSDPTSIPVGKP